MEKTIRAKINHHTLNTGVTNGKTWKRLNLYLLQELFINDCRCYGGVGWFVCWNQLTEQFDPISKDQVYEVTFRKVQKTIQGKTTEVNEIIACKRAELGS